MSANKSALAIGADKEKRCRWCTGDAEYVRYHDYEWGRAVTDENLVYEKICLEGFQSGLSWLTILRKRPAFREAFANFEPSRVAKFGSRDVARLLKNENIVRHRGKIEATINNAKRTLELQQDVGSLAKFFWSFCPDSPKNSGGTSRKSPKTSSEILPSTPESIALSKALRARGFSFVGPTTMYAAMQSLGVVNDHFIGCHVQQICTNLHKIALKKMIA